jgi:hypothetical protein
MEIIERAIMKITAQFNSDDKFKKPLKINAG